MIKQIKELMAELGIQEGATIQDTIKLIKQFILDLKADNKAKDAIIKGWEEKNKKDADKMSE